MSNSHDAPAANVNEKLGLVVEVVSVPYAPGHWLVEAVDHGSEGEIYRATFDGCDAEQRARKYAQALAAHDASPTGEGEGGAVRELLPCPFCGGRAHLEDGAPHDPSGWTGQCLKCDFSLEFKESRAEAVAAWNRRNPSPPIQAAGVGRDELREQIGAHVRDAFIASRSVAQVTADILALLPQPSQSPSPALDVSGGKGERVMCPLCDGAGLINSLPPVDTGKALRRRGEASSPSQVAAPAGWRMVPVEPVREMWAAMGDAVVGCHSKHHDHISEAVWNAALSASPPPPASGEGVDLEAVKQAGEFLASLREGLRISARDLVEIDCLLPRLAALSQPDPSKGGENG